MITAAFSLDPPSPPLVVQILKPIHPSATCTETNSEAQVFPLAGVDHLCNLFNRAYQIIMRTQIDLILKDAPVLPVGLCMRVSVKSNNALPQSHGYQAAHTQQKHLTPFALNWRMNSGKAHSHNCLRRTLADSASKTNLELIDTLCWVRPLRYPQASVWA